MSDFLKLNWGDLVKGFLLACLTAFVGSLYTLLSTGVFPTLADLHMWLPAAIAAGIAYLKMALFQNSSGTFGSSK